MSVPPTDSPALSRLQKALHRQGIHVAKDAHNGDVYRIHNEAA